MVKSSTQKCPLAGKSFPVLSEAAFKKASPSTEAEHPMGHKTRRQSHTQLWDQPLPTGSTLHEGHQIAVWYSDEIIKTTRQRNALYLVISKLDEYFIQHSVQFPQSNYRLHLPQNAVT